MFVLRERGVTAHPRRFSSSRRQDDFRGLWIRTRPARLATTGMTRDLDTHARTEAPA